MAPSIFCLDVSSFFLLVRVALKPALKLRSLHLNTPPSCRFAVFQYKPIFSHDYLTSRKTTLDAVFSVRLTAAVMAVKLACRQCGTEFDLSE